MLQEYLDDDDGDDDDVDDDECEVISIKIWINFWFDIKYNQN